MTNGKTYKKEKMAFNGVTFFLFKFVKYIFKIINIKRLENIHFFLSRLFWENRFWTFFLSIFENRNDFLGKTIDLLHN